MSRGARSDAPASPEGDAGRDPRSSRAAGFRLVALAATPCVLLLGAALLIARAESIEVDVLLRDTAAVVEAPVYVGLVSNVGILLWGACVAICAFAAVVLRRTSPDAADVGFFAAAAALTAWLMLDDALLLHEQAFRRYLGLPGALSVGIALAGLVAFLAAFRRRVFAGGHPVLLAALGLFGVSVLFDALEDAHLLWLVRMGSGTASILVEDGAKLLGIALWLAFFCTAALERLTGVRRAGPDTG